jgi:anti-sigma B factor antagonist
VIALAGELDMAAEPRVTAQVGRAVADGADVVVLDLREVTFLDSTGVRALVLAHRRCEEAGRRLFVVRGRPSVHRVLVLCGIDARLALVDGPDHVPDLVAVPRATDASAPPAAADAVG